MKRAIVIEVLLLFVLVVLILGCIGFWDMTIRSFYYNELIKAFFYLPSCILISLATIADIAVIVLVTLKELPAFKPLIDKLKLSKEERKQIKKQARIEKLQDELDELKKDE